jgi:hypothetical protein
MSTPETAPELVMSYRKQSIVSLRKSITLGYPNSPIMADPEMIQNGIPNPSNIRATMYMPTAIISPELCMRNHSRTINRQTLNNGTED